MFARRTGRSPCFSPSSMRARRTIWRLTGSLSAAVAFPAKTRARSRTSCVSMRRTFVLFSNIIASCRSRCLYIFYLIYNLYRDISTTSSEIARAGPEHSVKSVKEGQSCMSKCSARRSRTRRRSVEDSGVIPLVVMFAWVLWHDLSVYRAADLKPLAGPTYQVTSYDSQAECEAEQRTAMAKEELPRAGPRTERLFDG